MATLKIFVSYNRDNRKEVEKVVEALKALGHIVWYDQDLNGGEAWWTKILDEIRTCHIFVASITKQSLESVPCNREMEYALALGKAVIPLVMQSSVDKDKLPDKVRPIQCLDYHRHNMKNYYKLIESIRTHFPEPEPLALPALPDPIPAPPPTPESPWEIVKRHLDAGGELSGDDQKSFLTTLRDYLKAPRTPRDARATREVVKEFPRRPEVRVTTERDALEIIRDLYVYTINGHKRGVRGVDFHPNGSRFFTASLDGWVRGWDWDTGAMVWEQDITTPLYCLAANPKGHDLAIGGHDGALRLRHLGSGYHFQAFNAHQGPMTAVAYSPNGESLVSGGQDGSMRAFDVSQLARGMNEIPGHTRTVNSVAYSPDGRRIVSASDDYSIRMWDARTGNLIHKVEMPMRRFYSAHFNLDGQYVVTASDDGIIRVWHAHTLTEAFALNANAGEVYVARFNQNGRLIISIHHDRALRVWDVATRSVALEVMDAHNGKTQCLAFHPQDPFAVSGGEDKTARIWDVSAIGGEQLAMR